MSTFHQADSRRRSTAIFEGLWALSAWLCFAFISPKLFAASEASILEGLRPKKFVLSIGVGQFESPMWHPLRYARKDAEDIYSYFHREGQTFDGGELLTDGERPIGVDEVKRAFERIQQDNRNEDDTVIVYLSTHGTVAYKEDGKVGRYIIMSGTDPQNMKNTALDYDQLIDLFQKLKSRKKVLILAFCHSGVGKSVLTPEMKRALAQLKAPYFEEPIQERSEGSIILTASGWREPALEDERLQNDVYTHFLIEGFKEDRNGDGAVSITEAHAYAGQATYAYTQGRQRPSAIMELLGSDPVIVSGQLKKKSASASLFSLMDRFSKLVVAIDGKEYGAVTKGLSVPEGDVRLTVKDPDTHKVLADRVVNFQAGREYSIANYLLPRLPNSLTVGMRSLQFIDSSVQDAYAPESAQGVDLRYTFEEAIWVHDVSLELTLFPEQREEIEVKQSDSSYSKFQQKRQMVSALLGLGRRHSIERLSSGDRSVRTEARWLAGVGGLYVERTLDEPAFKARDRSVFAPQLGFGAGIDATWAYHLLRVGSEVRIDLVRNFTDTPGSVLIAPTLAVYAGTFW